MAKVLKVRISDTLATKIDTLAEKTKRPKSFYLTKMLEQYMDEYADAYLALEWLNDKNSKYLTTQELEKRLEL